MSAEPEWLNQSVQASGRTLIHAGSGGFFRQDYVSGNPAFPPHGARGPFEVQSSLKSGVVMKTENGIPDKDEIFRHLLLVGGLFASPALDGQDKLIRDVLRKSGITLNRSDFQILDRCTLGASSVLIVRYMLEYTVDRDPAGKEFRLEGSVASEVDFRGNVHIRILSKPLPQYPDVEAAQSRLSPVKGNP